MERGMTDEPTPGELRRVLTDVRDEQRATVRAVQALTLSVARLEERFTAHVDAQAARTLARDVRCAEHLGLIRAVEAEVGEVRSVQGAATAVVGEQRRSWSSWVQTTASAAAVVGAAYAVLKG